MARVASPFLGSDCQSPPSKSSSWDRNKIIGQLQVEGFEILELWEEKSEGKRCIERIYSNSGCTLTMDACSHYLLVLAKNSTDGLYQELEPFSTTICSLIETPITCRYRAVMAYMLQREGVEFYSYLVGYSTRKAVVDSETLCGLKLSYQSRYIFTENGTECASSCNITSAIYPLIKEPVKCRVRSDLRAKDLSNIRKFADGTNATVYLVEFEGKEVIMKMIKKTFENNRYVVAEFETERLILERSSHQNIIKIIGAGNDPRKFILLEYLNEGTLADILAKNQSQTKLGRIFFPRVTFSWPELLRRALELAEALKYLHEDCFKDSTIIHRDLKPDNIGFVDGKLKLFDMGLSICVAKSANPSDAFEMTGCTGTLRYMAPEVALNKPYSEKSDVYSYGIILWQMASDRIPFKRAGKTAFYECVVTDGLRPDLRTSWPKEFQGLLAACWQSDASKRPSFSKIQDILFSLQNAI